MYPSSSLQAFVHGKKIGIEEGLLRTKVASGAIGVGLECAYIDLGGSSARGSFLETLRRILSLGLNSRVQMPAELIDDMLAGLGELEPTLSTKQAAVSSQLQL